MSKILSNIFSFKVRENLNKMSYLTYDKIRKLCDFQRNEYTAFKSNNPNA